MYILDTDHLSFVQREGQEGLRILNRLSSVAAIEVAVSVVTFEEQVRGRLSMVSRAKSTDEQVKAYQWLRRLLDDYRLIRVIPFDATAATIYQRIRRVYPRLGSMDLKIAAVALAQNAVLLTRNLSDFAQIEGLILEDWSRA